MSLIARANKARRGFSLIEVLAALIVAGVLSAALTRSFGITRANAGRIRELIDMMALSNNLLQQVHAGKVQAGKIDGRSGNLSWRMEIVPAAYSVTTLQTSSNSPDSGTGNPGNPAGLAITNDKLGDAAANNQPPDEWTAYRISIIVRSSSGRRYAADAIKTGHRTAEERQR